MKQLSIIVPYRNRENHLNQFIPHMKEFLKTQVQDYEIIIVEQMNEKPFNRAKLLNIGFDYDKGNSLNYCMHDVDMLPIESDYTEVKFPTHLAVRVEQFNWGLAYDTYFGGVTIFDKESFEKINGYSNNYTSYAGEDDSSWNRCVAMKLPIKRKNGMYKSLPHEKFTGWNTPEYAKILENLNNFYPNEFDGTKIIEGLSTLEYNLVSVEKHEDYTHIKAKIYEDD